MPFAELLCPLPAVPELVEDDSRMVAGLVTVELAVAAAFVVGVAKVMPSVV